MVYQRYDREKGAVAYLQRVVASRGAWCGSGREPVGHIELCVPLVCGGSARACVWRQIAVHTRLVDAGPGCQLDCCGPGAVHYGSFSVVMERAYCVRVLLNREFKNSDGGHSYGAFCLEVDEEAFGRVLGTALQFVRASHERTNREYNARFPDTPVPEASIGYYHERVNQALDPAETVDPGPTTVAGLVAACLSMPCTGPPAMYNTTGLYWNYVPCATFGIRRDEFTSRDKEGRETFLPVRVRPVVCSEFVAVLVELAGHALGADPAKLTPNDVYCRLIEHNVPQGMPPQPVSPFAAASRLTDPGRQQP